MLFEYAYRQSSAVRNDGDATSMSFAPDTLRPATFFRGQLRQKVPFREAISALHDVVVSDLRWKPKDRTAYQEWLAQQDFVDLAEARGQREALATEIRQLSNELSELDRGRHARLAPFYRAQQRYFDYIYKRDYQAWLVLDPVITVHPDQVFFECFSLDESSYGRLSASYEVFDELGQRSCGTTNIDYSQALYNEFQKVRSYKRTAFEIDPSGFDVQTSGEESYKEVKIDLPDSWVRGFLQVSSAMGLPASVVDLHPMDVHNLCFVMRRRRELLGPRSLRFRLTPGNPVTVVFDPWGLEVPCPRSVYRGSSEQEIRVWGRRRLHILERLIPIARRFTVHLVGSGMPSFWVADLGDMSFTLGLSGWTANNWSDAGNFDLMVAREDVDQPTKERVFDALKQDWRETGPSLAKRLALDPAVVSSALTAYAQAGRAIYDLADGVYRARELSRAPLPVEKLRFANEREATAARLLIDGNVAVRATAATDGHLRLDGIVRDGGQVYRPTAVFDAERRMVTGECSCSYYIYNRLYRGPCPHMLAMRLADQRGISDKIAGEDFAPIEAAQVAQSAEGSKRPRPAVAAEAAPATGTEAPAEGEPAEAKPKGGFFRRLWRSIIGASGTGASDDASDGNNDPDNNDSQEDS